MSRFEVDIFLGLIYIYEGSLKMIFSFWLIESLILKLNYFIFFYYGV